MDDGRREFEHNRTMKQTVADSGTFDCSPSHSHPYPYSHHHTYVALQIVDLFIRHRLRYAAGGSIMWVVWERAGVNSKTDRRLRQLARTVETLLNGFNLGPINC